MFHRPFERKHLEVWEQHIQKLFKTHVDSPVELKIQTSCEIIWEHHELGRGSYGQVYRAVRKDDQTKVAAKKLSSLQNSGGFIKLDVIRDLWFSNMLKHENIVKLFFICVHARLAGSDVVPFVTLVMELCACNLREVILSGRIQTDSQRRCIMQQFLRGLRFLHSNNVMHRDLKPENVLVSMEGILKITDFGTARFKHLNSQTGPYTRIVCTEPYAPPEQHLGIEHYNESFDMWSVGCIMTELWTQSLLFKNPTLFKIIDLCGEINESTLPGVEAVSMYNIVQTYRRGHGRVLEEVLTDYGIPFCAVELIGRLLVLITWQRLSAEGALSHSFFVLIPDEVHDLKSLLP